MNRKSTAGHHVYEYTSCIIRGTGRNLVAPSSYLFTRATAEQD